jgi:DNA-binding LacI/PurR family transcriptional regulator
MSKKAATLADVAREAGISKTTASHALSGKGWVSSKTRDAVLEAALRLGFEVDPLAQRLSVGRCPRTIGFYSLDIDLSGRTRQLQIIQAALNDLGFSVPIHAYGYRGSHLEQNQMDVMSTMLSQRPRAVVCNMSGVLPQVMARLERFQEEGGIVVCYGYGSARDITCDQVLFDEEHSTYLAARHLLELGHRDIGLFNVGQRVPATDTLLGFERALGEFGVDVRPEWLFGNEGVLRYEEEGVLLAEQFLRLKQRPTGMCVANDYAATAFVSTLVRAGVRVPEDVSVVGDDDDPIAPHGVVPLTTISQPIEPITVQVIQMLQERLETTFSGPPRTVIVQGELVLRRSTAEATENASPVPKNAVKCIAR